MENQNKIEELEQKIWQGILRYLAKNSKNKITSGKWGIDVVEGKLSSINCAMCALGASVCGMGVPEGIIFAPVSTVSLLLNIDRSWAEAFIAGYDTWSVVAATQSDAFISNNYCRQLFLMGSRIREKAERLPQWSGYIINHPSPTSSV